MSEPIFVGEVVPGAAPDEELVIDEQRLGTTLAALGLDPAGPGARVDQIVRELLEQSTDEPYPIRLGQWSITMPVERFRGILSAALLVAAIEQTNAPRTALVVLAAIVPFLFDIDKVRLDRAEHRVVADPRAALSTDEDRQRAWASLPDHLRHELPYLRFADLYDQLRASGALRDAPDSTDRPSATIFQQRIDGWSDDALDVASPTVTHAPRVLLVATDWFSRRGGLSTFNRLLAHGLAEAGASVVCLLPDATPDEEADARRSGVSLVAPEPIRGATPEQMLMLAAPIYHTESPDIIIGHGRITGPTAVAQARSFPDAHRCQVIHVAPDEIEFRKSDPDGAVAHRAYNRTERELELARTARCVVTVGPRLYERFHRDLQVSDSVPIIVRLDPGFDEPSPTVRIVPSGVPQILLLGRWGDAQLKGLDIAARAIGHAVRLASHREPNVEVLIRGVPDREVGELVAMVRKLSGLPALSVVPRPYTADLVPIREDLRRASVLLMPSRAEGFGLVGLEAITAGTPVLVSGASGLGMLLREVLPAEQADRFVVSVTENEAADTETWGHHIAAVLRDRAAAFRNAHELHTTMAQKRTWPQACARLLDIVRGAAVPRADGR